MHPSTFEIKEFETEKERLKEGFTIPLSRSEARKLKNKTPKERALWISTRDRNRRRKVSQ